MVSSLAFSSVQVKWKFNASVDFKLQTKISLLEMRKTVGLETVSSKTWNPGSGSRNLLRWKCI